MYDHRFFQSKLGQAAIVSIAAMLAFNVMVFCQQWETTAVPLALATQSVELA